jgi:hypothetical protein
MYAGGLVARPKLSDEEKLVQKLLKDPKAAAPYAREMIVRATVKLGMLMTGSITGPNATSQYVQVIKELMTNIELLLEEAGGDDRPEKGKQNLAPKKASSTSGARTVWQGGNAKQVAGADPDPLGEPPVELPDRPK